MKASKLPEVIRTRRMKLKLSQAAVAEKVGVDQASISRIEKDLKGAQFLTVLSIFAALDITLWMSKNGDQTKIKITDEDAA